MATVNLGRIKPVNKGTWSSSTTYAVDDFVQYTDSGVLSTYIAVASGSNQAPSTSGTENSSHWKYMSKGTTVAVGNNKVVVSDGSGNLTGQTIGTAGQSLKVNSGANGFEFGNIPTNRSGIAFFSYVDSSGLFRDLWGATNPGSGDRMLLPFNETYDPYSVLSSIGSNTFNVATTGVYTLNIHFTNHVPNHYCGPFIYDESSGAFAKKPNAGFTGSINETAPMVGYVASQGAGLNESDALYYLENNKQYSFRFSADGAMGVFSTTTNYVLANYTVSGVVKNNSLFRATITKMEAV
tara:strand:- start:4687 stop:5571 length:885 start_codon:yes stop_codon:yes gene_type:complete